MKCIKAVKPTKYVEVGEIRRINDKEAESEVKGGYWKYTSKTEWKQSTRVEKEPEQPKQPKKNKNEKNNK
jgi:hypothetical protein